MTPEKALGLANPSSLLVAISDTYVSKSNDFMFSGVERYPMVVLPLLREMNKATGFDVTDIAHNIADKVESMHGKVHQFEGPHADLSADKLNASLRYPGESAAVADMAVSWMREQIVSPEDFMETYAMAVAFVISKYVHTNAQAEYIAVSVC